MTAIRKYVDIDDYGNFENIIKKVEPSYTDITARLPGPLANFAQQQMSLAIAKDPFGPPNKDTEPFKPHQMFLMMKRSQANDPSKSFP